MGRGGVFDWTSQFSRLTVRKIKVGHRFIGVGLYPSLSRSSSRKKRQPKEGIFLVISVDEEEKSFGPINIFRNKGIDQGENRELRSPPL